MTPEFDLHEIATEARRLPPDDSRRVSALGALNSAKHLADQYERKVAEARQALAGGPREPVLR